MKRAGNEVLTKRFIKHILDNIIEKAQLATIFPPALQFFEPGLIFEFKEFERFGEYDIGFLLVVIELIMIQEVTNYLTGTMNKKLFERMYNHADIFSLVSAASFGGR
jgi:hypothetical protein